MYHDAYEIYELLDSWNHRGPPIAENARRLFLSKPDEARRRFLYGQTLLHKCIESYGDKIDLIEVLIEGHPDALMVIDDNGYLPLHIALKCSKGRTWNLTLELVKLLINHSPESIITAIESSSGALPLHLACQLTNNPARINTNDSISSSIADIVQYIIDCYPDAIQYRDNNGSFPLNYAMEMAENDEQNDEVVEKLVKAYPVILSFADDDGRLPLHRILKRNSERYSKIIDILVDHYPGTLRLQDSTTKGQTPLLQACINNNPTSQIYSLIRKWPEQVIPSQSATSIFQSDRFNGEMLPSTLISKSMTIQKVTKWIHIHPHVISERDLQGRLPIHYAVLSKSKSAIDIVKYLLDKSTDTSDTAPGGSSSIQSMLSAIDNHGRLPLHYAAVRCTTSSSDDYDTQSLNGTNAITNDIIDFLIELYPEGLLQTDHDGRLPWHYGDCARNDILYSKMNELYPNVDYDLELVPEEIRWDVTQISA